MCARPLKPESERKHPYIKRKSTSFAPQLDIPPPSARAVKRAKPFVDYLIKLVLTNDNLHDQPRKNKARIRFAKGQKPPKDWPSGRVKETFEDGSRIMEWNAELLLLWYWERKLSPYYPGQLYEARKGLMQSMNGMLGNVLSDPDRRLDRMIDDFKESE